MDISFNKILLLPPSVGSLENLVELDCRSNRLKSIPEELKKCKQLKTLLLYKNDISVLPDIFMSFQKLETLDLGFKTLFLI